MQRHSLNKPWSFAPKFLLLRVGIDPSNAYKLSKWFACLKKRKRTIILDSMFYGSCLKTFSQWNPTKLIPSESTCHSDNLWDFGIPYFQIFSDTPETKRRFSASPKGGLRNGFRQKLHPSQTFFSPDNGRWTRPKRSSVLFTRRVDCERNWKSTTRSSCW